jgi:hypothetical protein
MREVLAFSIRIIPQNWQPRIGNQAIFRPQNVRQRADWWRRSTKQYGVLK